MQVYKIINILNEKSYIGKDERDRKNYFGSGKIIKLAIKKYGIENFRKEIIEECHSREELINREIFWIKELKSITPNGYNISSGGNGGDTTSNHPNKKNIIQKRINSNKGKKRSQEFKENCRKIALSVDPKIRKKAGKKAAITKKKRIINEGYTDAELKAHKMNGKNLANYNRSEIGRKAVSRALKGKSKKPFSEEHKNNIGKASNGRKIPGRKIQIEKHKFESLHEASRKLGIPLMTIRNRLININFPEWNYIDS